MKKIIIILILIFNLVPFFNYKGISISTGELMAQTSGDEGNSSSGSTGTSGGYPTYSGGIFSDGGVMTFPPVTDPSTGTGTMQTSASLSDGSNVPMHSIDPMPLNQIPSSISTSSGLAPSTFNYSGGEAQVTCGGGTSSGGGISSGGDGYFNMMVSMYSSACGSTYSSSSDFINSLENTMNQGLPDASNTIVSIGTIDNGTALVTVATNDAPNGGWQITQAITVNVPQAIIQPPKALPKVPCTSTAEKYGNKAADLIKNNTKVADYYRQLRSPDLMEYAFAIKQDKTDKTKIYPTDDIYHSSAADLAMVSCPCNTPASASDDIVATVHTHPSNSCFSPGDLYTFLECNSKNSNFAQEYVITSNGTEYVMIIDDQSAATKFLETYSRSDNTTNSGHSWANNSKLWYDIKEAKNNISNWQGYNTNDAMALGLAYMLEKYNTGIKLLKRNNTDQKFQELKVTKDADLYKPTITDC